MEYVLISSDGQPTQIGRIEVSGGRIDPRARELGRGTLVVIDPHAGAVRLAHEPGVGCGEPRPTDAVTYGRAVGVDGTPLMGVRVVGCGTAAISTSTGDFELEVSREDLPCRLAAWCPRPDDDGGRRWIAGPSVYVGGDDVVTVVAPDVEPYDRRDTDDADVEGMREVRDVLIGSRNVERAGLNRPERIDAFTESIEEYEQLIDEYLAGWCGPAR